MSWKIIRTCQHQHVHEHAQEQDEEQVQPMGDEPMNAPNMDAT
jgi:hypothetical protein